MTRAQRSRRLPVFVAELAADDEGQALVEYALIVSLLSVTCIAGFHAVTSAANNNLSNTSNNLTTTSANPP